MKITYSKLKISLFAGIGFLVMAGVVAYAATTLILAVGTIPDSDLVAGTATVTVRTLTINPGEVLPWHYHPGYAFNVVKSGVLTVEDGCSEENESLTPGQAFEETAGHVHRAKNLGTEPVVVYNTFVIPQGRPTTVNIPNNERRCGPASYVDECKEGGWANFTHPAAFNNQGECVAYVRKRPRISLLVPEDPLAP